MMAAVNLTLSLPAEPNIDRWLADKPVGAFIEQLQPLQPLLFETAAIKPLTEQWIRNEIVNVFALDDAKTEKIQSLVENWYTQLSEKKATDPMPKVHRFNKIKSNFVCLEWARSQWFAKVESIYLANRSNLDLFKCSLIRLKSKNLALEIYHQIKAGELTFSSASAEYGHGPEVKNGGRLGSLPLSGLPYGMEKIVVKMSPGNLSMPSRLGSDFALIFLESRTDCPLDSNTESHIYQNLLDLWVGSAADNIIGHMIE